jgi:hypothetical protein
MTPAPIALFAYARLEHTRRTIEALQRNDLAESSDLIIFSDAAASRDLAESVECIRSFLPSIEGFRSVTVHHRPHNFGLARSIIEGVTEVLSTNDRIIVLEDDMVTSPFFLTYMNQALDRFANDERVASIHGYVYPVELPLPEAFFLLGADCWGWATWRRGWKLFNPDGQALLDQLIGRQLVDSFDFNGSYPYTRMLRNQIQGANDSWAIRWYASAFAAGKLTLYPGRSLVHNIGIDSSGTHCGTSTLHDVVLSPTPINLAKLEVLPCAEAAAAFEAFFRKGRDRSPRKLLHWARQFLARVFA